MLSHRIEATFRTKRSGLVIMMSRYRLFTHILCRRVQLGANKPMIAFTINKKCILFCYPRLVFILAKCLRQDSSWQIAENRKDLFPELNTLHVVKEPSQMIC